MDGLENNIRDRFHEDKLSVSEEEALSLWSSIETDLPKPKGRKIPIIWISFVGFLIGFVIIYSFAISSIEPNADIKSVNRMNHLKEKESKSAPNNIVVSTESASSVNALEEQVIALELKSKTKESHSQILSDKLKKSLVKPITLKESFYTSRENLSEIEIKETTVLKTEKEVNKLNSIDHLAKLNKLNLQVLQSNMFNLKSPFIESTGSDYKLSLSLYFGLNNSRIRYSSTDLSQIADLKNNTEVGEFGSTSGIDIKLVKANRFLVNTGLEWSRTWTRFDYEENTTEKVLKENQLIKVVIDENTLDTIDKIYVDTLINVYRNRKIRHHNKSQFVSIPILFGVQHQINHWQLSLAMGLQFNFVEDQQGKSINELGEIYTYRSLMSDARSLPYDKFSVGWRLKPSVSYCFNEKWAFGFSPSINGLSGSNLFGTDMSGRYLLIQYNAGISYCF